MVKLFIKSLPIIFLSQLLLGILIGVNLYLLVENLKFIFDI